MANKRGWPDWIKGIALYGLRPDGTLGLIMTDEAGNLRVVHMPHAHTHEDGGSDEIDVTGLSGVLRNLQKAKWSIYDTRANFPPGEEVGALAYATDEKTLYRWDGASWVKVLSLDLMQLVNRLHATTHESGGDDPIDFLKLTNRKHASKHQSGGDDEIDVTGLHGELADPQTPKAHASTHQPGGSDALPTGAPSAITEGATGSEGSSTKFARADHVHQTPSEWTPREHGNEKHNPDFLAVDGSNKMTGHLQGGTIPPPVIAQFVVQAHPESLTHFVIPMLANDIAFNIVRGGSVSFSPSPSGGTADQLFNGKLDFVWWNSPSPPIVVEVVFWKTFYYRLHIGLVMTPWARATDFSVEVYKPSSGVWDTVATVTGWPLGVWSTSYDAGGGGISKIRFTFTGFNSSIAFRLVQIFLADCFGRAYLGYTLNCGGDDIYGNIDMNGNDILSPGLVDGVDVSAHAARHHSGGADQIYWNQLAINGNPNLNGYKILNPAGASGGMVAGVKWVDAVVYSGNPPSSWTLLDLSGHVGDRRALCVFRIDRPNATNNRLYQIAPADAYDLAVDEGFTLGPNSCWVKAGGYGYIISLTDSQGRVRIRSESAESTDKVRLLCYFTVT